MAGVCRLCSRNEYPAVGRVLDLVLGPRVPARLEAVPQRVLHCLNLFGLQDVSRVKFYLALDAAKTLVHV